MALASPLLNRLQSLGFISPLNNSRRAKTVIHRSILTVRGSDPKGKLRTLRKSTHSVAISFSRLVIRVILAYSQNVQS